MEIEITQFRCKLCSQWKGLQAHHPHPEYHDLCRVCVKPMRNKVASHNRRMWKNHPSVNSDNIPGLLATDWIGILRKHNFCCAGCGAHATKNTILTLDHIYPLALGGLNQPFNIQPLCEKCHSLKDLAPTTMPWEMESFAKKAAKTARRKKARNKDFQVFKDLGAMPTGIFWKQARKAYDENEEYKFYRNFHEYLIELLLMHWLDNKTTERRTNDQSISQAA